MKLTLILLCVYLPLQVLAHLSLYSPTPQRPLALIFRQYLVEYWSVTPEGVAAVVGTAVTFEWIVVDNVEGPFPIQKRF